MEIKNHDEQHDSAGDYVKSMIFGGLDGVLTSFAVVAGAAGESGTGRKHARTTLRAAGWVLRPPGVWAGGHLGVETVLILGFSNIFADAFAMGMGEFLSSKAHNEYVLKERQREK